MSGVVFPTIAAVEPTSVLLTCAGQRVDMVRAFREALADEGRGGIVVAGDLDPLSPALYAADVRVLRRASTTPGTWTHCCSACASTARAPSCR